MPRSTTLLPACFAISALLLIASDSTRVPYPAARYGPLVLAAGRAHCAAGSTPVGAFREPNADTAAVHRESDDLATGITSLRAGRFDEALALLDGSVQNPVLEGYRRYCRAQALYRDSCYAECLDELGAFFALTAKDSTVSRHPVIDEAVNLDIVARTLNGTRHIPAAYALRDSSVLKRGTLFALARFHLRDGDYGRAAAYLQQGSVARPDSSSTGVFSELVELLEPFFDRLSKEQLSSIIQLALQIGAPEPAAAALKSLQRRCPNDYDVHFLNARMLSLSGKSRSALTHFRRLFNSDAPVSVKKASLLMIASLEYGLKRRDRASESYRLFGMYYPTDPRSAAALDTAARLEIAGGRWARALAAWGEIRKRGDSSAVGQEAALGEAVLRFWLGDSAGAQSVLEGLLPVVNGGLEPAVLYWLQRSGSTGAEREKWSSLLVRRFPRSFYAGVTGSSVDSPLLVIREAPAEELADGGDHLERLQRTEQEYLSSIEETAAVCGPVHSLPLFEAHRYFAVHGLYEEASACGRLLLTLWSGDTGRLLALYKVARAEGLYNFARERAFLEGFANTDSEIPFPVAYPVVYPDIVREQSRKWMLPPDLILAVMREESNFDRYAVSCAGARGLMQILPSTGRWIAAKLGHHAVSTDDLFDPLFNIETGSWYLRYLLDRNGRSIIGGLAAYNAGLVRMKHWSKTFKPGQDPLVAVEMIGPVETRRYVKRVLDTLWAYRSFIEEGGG